MFAFALGEYITGGLLRLDSGCFSVENNLLFFLFCRVPGRGGNVIGLFYVKTVFFIIVFEGFSNRFQFVGFFPSRSYCLYYIIKIKIHSSCEIEYFVETHLRKLCVILRSRVLRVVCLH